MPISPPSHPEWLDMPPLPVVDGIPTTDILDAADTFCSKASEGFRINMPQAYIAMREGFAYRYQLNQAKQNGALILKEVEIIRAEITKFGDKVTKLDDGFTKLGDEFTKLSDKMDRNHTELLGQLRYQDGFLRKGLNRVGLGGVWVPVKNQQGVHPAEKKLPPILSMEDLYRLSENQLRLYLTFYDHHAVSEGGNRNYQPWELRRLLMQCLTTPERDEPVSQRKFGDDTDGDHSS